VSYGSTDALLRTTLLLPCFTFPAFTKAVFPSSLPSYEMPTHEQDRSPDHIKNPVPHVQLLPVQSKLRCSCFSAVHKIDCASEEVIRTTLNVSSAHPSDCINHSRVNSIRASISAGAKIGHRTPRERCFTAEQKSSTAGSSFRDHLP